MVKLYFLAKIQKNTKSLVAISILNVADGNMSESTRKQTCN